MSVREPLDVLDAIQSTRAQRYLKPQAIPEPVLWKILDAAVRGPTGGNNQGWAWIVIRDPAIKQAIATVYALRPSSRTQRRVRIHGEREPTWVARSTARCRT